MKTNLAFIFFILLGIYFEIGELVMLGASLIAIKHYHRHDFYDYSAFIKKENNQSRRRQNDL